MLHIKIRSRLARGLAVHHKWFASRPLYADALGVVNYFHCQHRGEVTGFRRRPKFTILIDLTAREDVILGSFSENTRYKVNRGAREKLRMERETDVARFCCFLNAAADTKGRGHVTTSGVAPYWANMYVTKAVAADGTLAMHSYLFDVRIGRAALYHSASLYRLEKDSASRNRIGRANRWLHFADMLEFRRLGATVYDLGGIAKDTSNAELRQINEFKMGFGGVLVEESNYVSNIGVWWNRFRGGSGST